ncbi:MAG: hypothetical protein HZB33_10520 [Nitrospirae bacterium]|nr:hypothetical protein [Nitrospirota bacterium]
MNRIAVVAVLLLALAACSNRASELMGTAKFEELQNNRAHAVELYREIVAKYPDSPEAKEAASRLSAIQSAPDGTGK